MRSPQADDEITFDVDDIITNIEMVDEGWWKGQCGGRSGLFPASYVQMLPFLVCRWLIHVGYCPFSSSVAAGTTVATSCMSSIAAFPFARVRFSRASSLGSFFFLFSARIFLFHLLRRLLAILFCNF
ncbi:hypothetical protein CRUP_010538 [Coryphaenoides rupestris]|nr:hypothetical protein CRUP_010538 [Coryphaenoides rupestris]